MSKGLLAASASLQSGRAKVKRVDNPLRNLRHSQPAQLARRNLDGERNVLKVCADCLNCNEIIGARLKPAINQSASIDEQTDRRRLRVPLLWPGPEG